MIYYNNKAPLPVTDRRSDSKEFQTEYIQSSKYAARQVADIKPYLK
jgi:hypothetical protein